jgi:hypothetical protein
MPLIAVLHVKYAALATVAAARNCWDALVDETAVVDVGLTVVDVEVGLTVVDVEVGLTVVDVEVGLTVVDVEVDGVAAGLALEQAAAKTASPITTMYLAFIEPPRSPTWNPIPRRSLLTRSLSPVWTLVGHPAPSVHQISGPNVTKVSVPDASGSSHEWQGRCPSRVG